MKREDLKKLELADDVIDKIMVLHGADEQAHQTKVGTLETENAGFKKQITEANTAIEGFKKLDVDGIKKAADEWKAKAEAAQAEAEKQIAGLKFDHALDAALAAAKVKNIKAARALLNLEGLKLGDDGAIVGTDETKGLAKQLEAIKASDDYLFEGEGRAPQIVAGGNGKSILGDPATDAMRKAAGLPATK